MKMKIIVSLFIFGMVFSVVNVDSIKCNDYGSPDICIWTDKNSYCIGDLIYIHFKVGETSWGGTTTIDLIDYTTSGKEIYLIGGPFPSPSLEINPGQTYTISKIIEGPPGIETLRLEAMNAAGEGIIGTWLGHNTCSFSVKYCDPCEGVTCPEDGYVGEKYCKNRDVYRKYRDYYCEDGECEYREEERKIEDCDYGCENGGCTVDPCKNKTCPEDGYVGEKYCKNGDVYQKYRNYYCENGECKYREEERKIEDCKTGCENGECIVPDPIKRVIVKNCYEEYKYILSELLEFFIYYTQPPQTSIDFEIYLNEDMDIKNTTIKTDRVLNLNCGGDLVFLPTDTFATKKISDHYEVHIYDCSEVSPKDVLKYILAIIDILRGKDPDLPPVPEINYEIIVKFENGIEYIKKGDGRLPTINDFLESFSKDDIEDDGQIIVGMSPIDLLIIDSNGRKVGASYENGDFVGELNEIPGAFYSGRDFTPELIYLPKEIEYYDIKVTGTDNGDYDLIVMSYEKSSVGYEEKSDKIDKGEMKEYKVSLSENNEVSIEKKSDSNLILFLGLIIAIIIASIVLIFSRGHFQPPPERPTFKERPPRELPRRATVRKRPRESTRGISLLEVHKAKREDTGKNIVRIDKKTREKLGIEKGDYVYIMGEKKAKARVETAYKEDAGKNIIRIDKKLREKTGINFKDKVKIEKVEEDEE